MSVPDVAPVVVMFGVEIEAQPASGSINCAYVGVDPTESKDHAASVLEPVDAAAGDLVPVEVVVPTGEPVDDTVAAEDTLGATRVADADEDDVTVAACVAAGVAAGEPAGVLLDDAVPDAVLVAAGVPAGVTVAAPVLDGEEVADTDDEKDPSCVPDADCRVAVDDALGVDVAVLVTALVPEGVSVAAGVTVAAGVDVNVATGETDTAGVLVAAGVEFPDTTPVVPNTMLSMYMEPVPTAGAGLANNFTHRFAALSASAGSVMTPAVALFVAKLMTDVPPALADITVVYVPLEPPVV